MPIQTAARVLEVSESGFYEWRRRPPSARSIRHVWLTDLIHSVHAASRGTYGANRVHAELTLGQGITVGHNAVAMLMQRAGLAGLPGVRPRRRLVVLGETAADLVDRDFVRSEPDQLWVTDITEHRTREGLLRGGLRTSSVAGWWDGRSIAPPPRAWSPLPWGWRLGTADPPTGP